MKILYLCETIDVGSGWGRYTHDLITTVRKQGHEVVIIKGINAKGEGIPLIKRGLSMLRCAWQIKKYMKDVDLIHAIDFNPYGIIAYLSHGKIPYIVTALGTYSVAPLYRWKTKFLTRRTYNSANKVIAMSNYTKERLQQSGIKRDITVVQNGIDLDKFIQTHDNTAKPFILSVGALKKRKGYHISLKAFARIKDRFPDLRYKIVGGEPRYFKDMARDLGIADKVDFLMNISEQELRELYKTANLFLLPSVNDGHHFEGFGLVFLEAAASGLPIIGTKGNGIEDAVHDGVNGILVEQENVDMTANAISDILNNNDKWRGMNQESYRWSKEHSIENTTRQYIDIYKKVV